MRRRIVHSEKRADITKLETIGLIKKVKLEDDLKVSELSNSKYIASISNKIENFLNEKSKTNNSEEVLSETSSDKTSSLFCYDIKIHRQCPEKKGFYTHDIFDSNTEKVMILTNINERPEMTFSAVDMKNTTSFYYQEKNICHILDKTVASVLKIKYNEGKYSIITDSSGKQIRIPKSGERWVVIMKFRHIGNDDINF